MGNLAYTSCAYPAIAPPVRIPLTTLPERPCPYLHGRHATNRGIYVSGRLDPEFYHDLMDCGFRRSGRLIYQPVCRACRDCVPIRVITTAFTPDRSQRRCWQRNQDLAVQAGPPVPTDESFALYRRYATHRHNDQDAGDRDAFESFLYDSPVTTAQFAYRDGDGKLLAIGICDVSSRSLSSVYFYFDPDQPRRGLGTYGALREIDVARRAGIPFYYLGYWIRGCRGMDYKRRFRPNEILSPDGVWRQTQP